VNRIIVGYSGSERAERALARAARLAESRGVELLVVSVAPSAGVGEPFAVLEPTGSSVPAIPGPSAAGAPMPVPAPEAPQPDPRDIAEHQLEHARITLTGRRIEARYVVEIGDPADRLLALAEERDADLIVVGSREHGFLDRVLRRRADEVVAERARCDVLLVR
jgi:nucleotide-binding universal stress UspA family protein